MHIVISFSLVVHNFVNCGSINGMLVLLDENTLQIHNDGYWNRQDPGIVQVHEGGY